MSFFRRLLDRFTPAGRLSGSTGVRPNGPNSHVVTIADRSYWVQSQLQSTQPLEYWVRTSDVRDITNSVTVVAAPPAPEKVVPEVRRRLEEYFRQSGAKVSYH